MRLSPLTQTPLEEIGMGSISPKSYGCYHRLEGIEWCVYTGGMTTMSTTDGQEEYLSSVDPVTGSSVENLGGVAFQMVVKGMSWLWIWRRGTVKGILGGESCRGKSDEQGLEE